MHLVSALKGEALEHVESLIDGDADFDTIWKALEDHFGKLRNVIDATVAAFISVPTPNNISEMTGHFNTVKNKASNILRLDLTVEELLTQFYLLAVPNHFRAELERVFDPELDKYTFKSMATCVEQVSRQKRHQTVSPISCNFGNTQVTTATAIPHSSNNPPTDPKTDSNGHAYRPQR